MDRIVNLLMDFEKVFAERYPMLMQEQTAAGTQTGGRVVSRRHQGRAEDVFDADAGAVLSAYRRQSKLGRRVTTIHPL